jgi:RNase P protein component
LVIWEQEEQKNENRAWDSSKNSRIRILIMKSKTWAVTFSTRHRLQRRYQEAIPFDVRYCIHVRYCIFFILVLYSSRCSRCHVSELPYWDMVVILWKK